MSLIVNIKPEDCYTRDSFEVSGLKFHKTQPGEYKDGKITVYCDQQDSQSWAAKIGSLKTGYYWYPEYAVEALLESTKDI